MVMARRIRLLAVLALALVLGGATAGCATWQGARLYRSGSAALDRGETGRAIDELERAAELVPRASEVQNHLGLAYQQAGREADARRAFARAVELDCDNEAARENLALAELRERGEP
jgi:Flp pilus assembly protein TadD